MIWSDGEGQKSCQRWPVRYSTNGDDPQLRALCQACPVLAVCREWVLEAAVDEGFAGGLSRLERRRLRATTAAVVR